MTEMDLHRHQEEDKSYNFAILYTFSYFNLFRAVDLIDLNKIFFIKLLYLFKIQ